MPHRLARGDHRGLPLLLAAISAIGPFSTDAYLPSFQEIGRAFGAPALLVQQTLTAYMIPFAVMTLWHGAISDALGRRRVTLGMLALFSLASVGCMLSWRIEALLFFRAVQGMTAGAGMVIGRALVRDLLEGAEAQRLMSRIALVFAIAPALGPVVGGWLHVWFGWRSVFAFLALFSAGLVVACWRGLPETLPAAQRRPLEVRSMASGYREVLGSPAFLALVLALTFCFSAVFVYIVSAPTFLVQHLRVPETAFLWLFGPISGGMLLGTSLSGALAGRVSPRRTVALAYAAMALSAGANAAFHAFFAPALPWSILPLVGYVLGTSLAMPSLTLMALDLFPSRRGLASSCQAFVQTSGNAVVTAVVAPLLWGSARGLAFGMMAMLAVGGASFLAYGVWRRCSAPAQDVIVGTNAL
ncbi:multidrug effflux MFS transporter [Anaeromyxobacter oryzisoli]|uniref:multidrug effflux MFS transporter n=1 Tax=Anaeromyxobacter oryzisoli TaxID=2925408 RepID=UPI001F5AFC73|nr:multidrug effflux MFS transporter [Anaeromyxobacter sp. SG63]